MAKYISTHKLKNLGQFFALKVEEGVNLYAGLKLRSHIAVYISWQENQCIVEGGRVQRHMKLFAAFTIYTTLSPRDEV